MAMTNASTWKNLTYTLVAQIDQEMEQHKAEMQEMQDRLTHLADQRKALSRV